VSQYASGPGPPAATGAHAWTRIARVQPPHAGHTAPAGAENASVGTGIQDRGLGPGRYHGPGLGQGRGSEIIMGASQGRARGRDLGTGDVRGLAQDRGPVLVPPRRPARDRGPGPSHAIGEADTESAHADLAPEVSPRVAAAAVAGTANGGEREVARRIGRREKGRKTEWRRLLLWVASGASMVLLVNPTSLPRSPNSARGLLRSAR